MSRAEARGHNFKGRLGAVPHDQVAERICCTACGQKMQPVINQTTGKPWPRCFTCEERENGPVRGRKRKR